MNKLFITLLAILSACASIEQNKPALQEIVIDGVEEVIEHAIEQATGQDVEVEINRVGEK